MTTHKPDIEKQLNNWDLFKSYGQFNLYFEAIVGRYRVLLIELVRSYYGFIDWEEDEEEAADFISDRLLKIILHDDGAFAIIEKCRSCFIDSYNIDVKRIQTINNIEPLVISEVDYNLALIVFLKSLELVKLRNIIIHSHYEGVVFHDIIPLDGLTGQKDVKTVKGLKGYEQKSYQLDVNYLDKLIEYMTDLYAYAYKLRFALSTEKQGDVFKQDDIEIVQSMNFDPRLIEKQ